MAKADCDIANFAHSHTSHSDRRRWNDGAWPGQAPLPLRLTHRPSHNGQRKYVKSGPGKGQQQQNTPLPRSRKLENRGQPPAQLSSTGALLSRKRRLGRFTWAGSPGGKKGSFPLSAAPQPLSALRLPPRREAARPAAPSLLACNFVGIRPLAERTPCPGGTSLSSVNKHPWYWYVVRTAEESLSSVRGLVGWFLGTHGAREMTGL